MLKDDLNTALKQFMRDKDMAKIAVLRQLLAAIKQIEIDERIELDDARVLAVLEKQLKQRKESILAFEQAKRLDLAQQEQFELNIIQTFLPEPLSAEALNALIDQAIASVQATTIKDMGKVMNAVRPHIAGRADASEVSALIKQRLA